MPNQLNYTSKISTTNFQRPTRVSENDIKLISSGSQQILYGTRDKDNVEVWAYNPNGTLAGHALLRPVDKELSLTTIVDTDGAKELLNLDMKSVALKMGLAPGRYAIVLNFFRDEVGSEDGYKLYISDISRDRTEIKLTPVKVDDSILYDIYEFIVPSVPKRFAEALIDQIFGKSLNADPREKITHDKVMDQLDQLITNTSSRIKSANVYNEYEQMLSKIIERVWDRVLDQLADDVNNFAIQEVEILAYVQKALDDVIYDMKQKGEIDHRFSII